MEKETKSDNEIIAGFMGDPIYYEYDRQFPSKKRTKVILRYDKSWDWLMPVVEKIESMTNVSVIIKKSRCRIFGGQSCKNMGHGLVIWQKGENRPLFVEVDKIELENLENELTK